MVPWMRHPTTTSRVPRNSNHCSGTLNFFTVLAGAPISSTNRLAAGTSFFACTTIAASWCFTASFSSARKNESSGRVFPSKAHHLPSCCSAASTSLTHLLRSSRSSS
eukprot:5631944-Prorocentrum_lima.AAC.1